MSGNPTCGKMNGGPCMPDIDPICKACYEKGDASPPTTEAVVRLNNLLAGCGNHGCEIREPHGVAANGRCRCVDKITGLVLDRLFGGTHPPRQLVRATIKLLIEQTS